MGYNNLYPLETLREAVLQSPTLSTAAEISRLIIGRP